MATYKGTLKTSNGDILYPATDASKVSGLSTVAISGSYNDLTDKPIVIQSKTFTDVIAYSTSDYYKYFGQIIPTDWNAVWSVRYRYKITCPNQVNCQSSHECLFSGSSGSLLAYSNFNEIKSTSYYPIYYTTLGRETEASYNAGYGHLLGVYFGSAWNPTSASYKRTFEIEILELINCTFTFFDTDKRASEIGTGFVLNNNTNADAVNQGLRETGDLDTTTLIRDYYTSLTMGSTSSAAATFIGVGADGKMVPILSDQAKSPFKYKGYVYRLNVAGSANTVLYDKGKDLIGTYVTLTVTAVGADIAWNAGDPVYLKGHISGELFTIDTTTNGGVVFSLPNSEDGYQYFFLGYSCIARTASQNKYITFTTEHPVYEYVNGAIREYVEVAHNADKLNGENSSYYLDYDNFTNTPDLSTYAHISDIADLQNIPPEVQGLLFYGGTLAGGAAPTATLTSAAKTKLGVTSDTVAIPPNSQATYKGIYFIASNSYASFYDNISFTAGDFIFSDGVKWHNLGKVINSGYFTEVHFSNSLGLENMSPEVQGLLFYGGTLAGGAISTATLTNAAKAKLGVTSATVTIPPGAEFIHKGIYYIASNNYASFYDNVSFVIGDCIFSDGIKWKNLGQVINSGFYNELHITNMTASGIEAIANKVTSIDEDSSDTQYPSAKCVYDLVGDIATLLADL